MWNSGYFVDFYEELKLGLLPYSVLKQHSPIFPLSLHRIGSRTFARNFASGYQTKVKFFPINLIDSNFLFDVSTRQGVLVDFGLAEVSS
jgi:hypothetical protein